MSTTIDPTAADFGALRSAIDGQLYTPADEGYDAARMAWNVAVDQRPAAVALPTSAHDVAEIVRFAAAAGLRVAPQGTGHGATPVGDLAGSILLRTTALADVRIDAGRRIARVGAGALWEQVVEPAAAHGLVALHGSSPDVGVAGYCLGGGIGWLARRHGLAANALTAVELVTADGRLVRADADNEPDLFWALRGGGGNFGIVTTLEMRLFPLDEVVAGWLIWPWEESHRVLTAWAAWAETVPDAVTSCGRLLQLPPIPQIPEPLRGRNLVVVEVAAIAAEVDAEALLAPLRALGPEIDTVAAMPPTGLVRLHQDPEGPTPGVGDGALLDALPAEAIDALLRDAGPGSGSPLLSVELRHLGGALGRPHPDGGALSSIDAGFALFAIGLPMDAEMGAAVAAGAEKLIAALAPWGHGRAYLNFAERRKGSETAFDADAHARLLAVRERFDPGRLMHANHPLG
ncbi:FAD-binding oxidoreductase [Miltoncostaea marina]|uniref:FAD-binding oxidoreductase n=1 Tax=Miltoncostaea marina TaxID=2843215 RepID=UPI001C3DB2D3|nr:FAD-binding oxidoreductase [Miltoncostaea marina]